MSLAQRLKDALPHELKRRVRESRHRNDSGPYSALLSMDQDMETIFDVGANVGNLSLAFLRWFPRATVHGFEPATKMFGEMNTRIESAGFASRFRGHQIGFYDKETQGDLHLSSHHGANSLMEIGEAYHAANPHIGSNATESIELVRMDDFVREAGIKHIDLVKIDVEGVENEVLRGGAETFSSMVDTVILELSFVRHERSEGNHIQLFQTMHELGFAPAYLFDIEQAEIGTPWRLSQVDCVFRKY
ncbi:MAG: FkbM family methyltransferase [Actinobacteria bacterium]|nr:FkbM family methyltransferase [Actinomycetota bacterium]MCG2808452.1 FkbM family methyltransferase [Coriobacteriia bacterium]